MTYDYGSNKDSKFINERVKAKKQSKKKILLKIVFVLLMSAAAAAVAAFVFVFTCDKLGSDLTAQNNTESKISISSTVEAATDDTSESIAVSESSADTDTSAEPEVIKEIVYSNQELTLSDYEELHEEMYAIAKEAQNSLVMFTGITSKLDYFNEAYENEQMSIGLIVAESSSEYYILTYYSILENVQKIQVTFNDEYSVTGSLQRNDTNTGLAVIKVEKASLPQEMTESVTPASFGNSSVINSGDLIMVIGNPDGYSDYIAYGAVTSVSNSISFYDAEYKILTTDIPKGSGGIGIIISLSGRVLGITCAESDSISDTTLSALAISDISELIEKLSNNEGSIYSGIKGYTVSEQISEQSGIPEGVMVVSIAENSPAMLSGMMEYDIITNVDEIQITSMSQYEEILKTYQSGETVNISVLRQVTTGYTQIDLTLDLGEI